MTETDDDDAGRSDTGGQPGESAKERVDRELIEFLNEVRVVLPGVQVLFAFLLTLPFTGKFGSLDAGQKVAYQIAFYAIAAAAVPCTSCHSTPGRHFSIAARSAASTMS